MTGRLQLIEQRLLGIDSAEFQNLCDLYLLSTEKDILSINRIGSQLGKKKTVKGTPDTFIRLEYNGIVYVEFTTTSKGIVNKIKGDIRKCLNSKITGIPKKDIQIIIIFYNSRLNSKEDQEIFQFAYSKKIALKLIGLDRLALDICLNYQFISKEILGIPFDTGQLLPLKSFIDEYNNKAAQLSTPLDNLFLHRSAELNDISNKLESSDLLIISGSSGVGKTRIAIQFMDMFLSRNKTYSALAVSNKNQDIYEDLKIHLQHNKDYILLIDDANRQLPNLKQILGVFKEVRSSNLKLIITVRDYAKSDIEKECIDFSYDETKLEKFTDPEITELIESDSFKITHSTYQRKIVEIADGNPRLAIMAARLALREQFGFLEGGGERIYELYDYYFKNFIKDFDLFGNNSLIKTLGIISFFYSIDTNDKVLISKVLESFNIAYYDFHDSISELEKRELVEVKFDNVRISEQVMSTYFFYKVFIKDELLTFKTLLFSFFPTHQSRFKDTIIPANNSFGYESVLKKVNSSLDDYLKSISYDEKRSLEFFSLFWFYKPEETLIYFKGKIELLAEPENPVYLTENKGNMPYWSHDSTLDLLDNFFDHNTESFIPALQLAFEFCRKAPDSLPELVKIIKERLVFDEEDHWVDFQRQIKFFNLLYDGLRKKEPHYIETFFAVAETFLKHIYHLIKGGRKLTIRTGYYSIPFCKAIKEFRYKLWMTLFENFKFYPNRVISILGHFNPGFNKANKDILAFDVLMLTEFFERSLEKSTFSHIHLAHKMVDLLDREDLSDRGYRKLKKKFISAEYLCFKKLDMDVVRGRQEYTFKNAEEFRILKEKEIKKSFVFNSPQEFELLHQSIKSAISADPSIKYSIHQSLNTIAEENFLNDNEIGFQFLKSIFMNYPLEMNPLHKPVICIIEKSEDWALRLWKEINSWKHESQLRWQSLFFNCLPDKFANEFYANELVRTFQETQSKWGELGNHSIEKFLTFNRNLVSDILEIVVKKIEGGQNLSLSFHFFENCSSTLSAKLELLSKAYIQQESNYFGTYDYSRKGLRAIIELNPDFLIEYLDSVLTKNNSRFDSHDNLTFIWDIPLKTSLIKIAVNLIIRKMPHGFSIHPLGIFFHNLNKEQNEKAQAFVISYIKKNNKSTNKMSAIFDIIKVSMNHLFEEALLLYLSLNSNVESFKRIQWSGEGGVYHGDAIIGDIRAKKWLVILTMVEKATNQLELLGIISFIKSEIAYYSRYGVSERKQKFINPSVW